MNNGKASYRGEWPLIDLKMCHHASDWIRSSLSVCNVYSKRADVALCSLKPGQLSASVSQTSVTRRGIRSWEHPASVATGHSSTKAKSNSYCRHKGRYAGHRTCSPSFRKLTSPDKSLIGDLFIRLLWKILFWKILFSSARLHVAGMVERSWLRTAGVKRTLT